MNNSDNFLLIVIDDFIDLYRLIKHLSSINCMY